MINQDTIIERLKEDGYYILPGHYTITAEMIEVADKLMNLPGYVCGNHYKGDNVKNIPVELHKVVYSDELQELFGALCENIVCQDVMMTHEYKNDEIARNNWLHFDRLRCWKAMVYLTDVEKGCGPFSVVPKSHKTGYQLRQAFINAPSYEEKRNRIKLDYPELYEEPTPLYGPAGTLILFDTDIFHWGGKGETGNERKLIRSHWYPNFQWRVES